MKGSASIGSAATKLAVTIALLVMAAPRGHFGAVRCLGVDCMLDGTVVGFGFNGTIYFHCVAGRRAGWDIRAVLPSEYYGGDENNGPISLWSSAIGTIWFGHPQVHTWSIGRAAVLTGVAIKIGLIPIFYLGIYRPIIYLKREYPRRKRVPGMCDNCGYDLRATPDRCPECGTAPINR